MLRIYWDKAFADCKKLSQEIRKIPFKGFSYFVDVIEESNKTIVSTDPDDGSIRSYEEIKTTTKIAIVTMPKPKAITESYFIGIYYHLTEAERVPEFRYFTLEYNAKDKSAICELKAGKHLNYGIQENMNATEFLEVIKRMVMKK